MEILGIGPLELLFIILIALIVLGPNDMVKAGRTLGRYMRMIVTSDTWRTIQQASRDLRVLPNRLMREAGLEDIQKDLKKNLPEAEIIRKEIGIDEMRKDLESWREDLADWTTSPMTIGTPEAPLSEQPANSPEPSETASEPKEQSEQS